MHQPHGVASILAELEKGSNLAANQRARQAMFPADTHRRRASAAYISLHCGSDRQGLDTVLANERNRMAQYVDIRSEAKQRRVR